MRTKLTLLILLMITFKGFSQNKSETIQTINQLLASAIGGTDSILIKGQITQLKITENAFKVDDDDKSGHFVIKLESENESIKKDRMTMISDWKGFKVHPSTNNTMLKTVYPIFEKRDGEPENDKNGIKYYCLAGNEYRLIASLLHLQNLYSKK
ncbi:hypothetical protein OQZ33_15145 [Pedobacter sp. MC2016-05]|uniref:hypothetical protein n=1 Tax=Pedobacter sp. MC2016-05 TaxID=2994474 RepID=UPI0022458610|nr:hypothetical protein [Pedobacter sp. MC2016-05]MCX2475668.1 hypothetical protein [Pedobacter sp. MC2016-05]